MKKTVVTYQSPRGNLISLCDRHLRECEAGGSHEWPKDPTDGQELCTVSHGKHSGHCDRCREGERSNAR